MKYRIIVDNRSGDSYSNIAFDPEGVHPSPGNPLGNRDMAKKLPEDINLTNGANWIEGGPSSSRPRAAGSLEEMLQRRAISH